MAGIGSRFKKIGFKKEKYEIIANGKSLFEWSLDSLSDFFDCEFIFIYLGEQSTEKFIHEKCNSLGIKKYKFIGLNEKTDGQASTVMQCKNLLSISDPICIYNIDTYIEKNQLLKQELNPDFYGFIPSFKAPGDKWSFIDIDSKLKKVNNVSEKIRISDFATTGFYYFKSWGIFEKIFIEYADAIKEKYNETYIAPMYNYLINENKLVSYSIIDSEKVHVLGTPEDIQIFCPNYFSENF